MYRKWRRPNWRPVAELRFEPESTAMQRIAAASKNVLRKFVPEFLLKQRSIVQRARPLTGEMVGHTDCIFAMDFQNKAELLTLYPEAQHKVYMLSAYAEGRRRYREIPDPYLGNLDTTKSCYKNLETCIRNLMASTFSVSRNEQKRTELARR